MIKNDTQVIDIDTVVDVFVRTIQVPEGVEVVTHSYLLDPFKQKLILTVTTSAPDPVAPDVS